MVAYELLHGRPPWFSEDAKELITGILQKPLTFPTRSSVSNEARSFIMGLLQKKFQSRLGHYGAYDVKSHRFLSSVDWKAMSASFISMSVSAPFEPINLNESQEDALNFDAEFTSVRIGETDVFPLDDYDEDQVPDGKDEIYSNMVAGFTFLRSIV